MFDLDFLIDARTPSRRELAVELVFTPGSILPAGERQVDLFAPVWTPGSYLVRDYARHHGRVTARGADGAELRCTKVAKNRVRVWIASPDEPVTLRWTVYAHDLSVRTADLTAAHAYWNHACLLLWPVLGDGLRARVRVTYPDGWHLANATDDRAVFERVAGELVRAVLPTCGLDEIVDSPLLLGRFQRLEWTSLGVPHAIVLDGLAGVEAPPTLVADLRAIVDQAARVFGGGLPYRRYVFLCLFSAEGHGGLEHAESTTLLFGRAAFASEKGYRDFLSLAAHELFHAWNVKRMRPVEFWRYDYERENCTEFLWLIEGWTAYYDDLLCLRAGLFTRVQYLEAMAKNIEAMFASPGRLRLGLRESSFDAWIRLYRPDENTKNASQNYYGNGAVAAMCLDLHVRRATAGRSCLDEVLRRLYAATFAQGRGYSLTDVHAALTEVAGAEAVPVLAALIDDRLDPHLVELLADFGVALVRRDSQRPMLGVQFENGAMAIAAVTAGTPAEEGGLHPGDEVLAVAGLRVTPASWQDVWNCTAKVDCPLEVLVARRGVLERVVVRPRGSPGTVGLELRTQANEEERRRLSEWLPEATAPS